MRKKMEETVRNWIAEAITNLDLQELVEIQNTIQAMLIHYGMEEADV